MGTEVMIQKEPVYVTKSFLPPKEEYINYLDKIWESSQLTNKGILLQDFELKVSDYLGVDYRKFQFVTNGTLALQLAIDGLGITDGDIITTPFTYVATTSAILWQRCNPVYVDIDPDTLNIDPSKIEAAITTDTKAILAVHVFGNPCDIEAIDKISKKHNLKVIYDAAHAFGVKYRGKSILKYGDVSILSFHATKLFHTIEGGGLYIKGKDVFKHIDLAKRFGHNGDDHYQLGINAKANEFQAAMGLVNLRYIDGNIRKRKKIYDTYKKLLGDSVKYQSIDNDTVYNYSYFPVIFDTEEALLKATNKLEDNNIYARRYFYPSLNTLPYVKDEYRTPVSEDISRRILCLPFYPDLEVDKMNTVKECIV